MVISRTTVILTACLVHCALAMRANFINSSYAGVVLGVKLRNRCNCVLLITTGPLGNLKVNALRCILGARSIYTLASERERLGKALANHHIHCSHTLVVFFEEIADRSDLIKVKTDSLSRKVGFSGPTWLLFLHGAEQPESALHDVDIAFDCKFLVAQFEDGQHVSITEVYRVAPHLPLQKNPYGSWSPGSGFTGPTQELYSRRNNLQGIVLRVATLNDTPMTIYNSNQPNEIDGYYGSVWKIIARRINFTMRVILPVTGSYGVRLANGSWDGVLGQIQRSEVDFGVSATAINSYRAQVPRFSVPLQRVEILIREPEGFEVSWRTIVSPFSPPLWVAVLLTALAAAIFLSYLYKFDRRFSLRTDQQNVSLYDTIFFVFGAIVCRQSLALNPRSLAFYIVCMVVYLFGIIIIGSYSAMLISFLTVFIPKMPFTDLKGLLADTAYSLGAQKDSAVISYFQETRDPLLKEAYVKKMSPGLGSAPLSHAQGFQRVCDREYAYIGATPLLAIMRKVVSCPLFPLPKPVSTTKGGYATYPKNSPYAGVLDHTILGMFQSGMIQRVSRQWSYGNSPPRVTSVKSVRFGEIVPFLSILVGGVLLGSALVLLEILVFCLQSYKTKYGVIRKKRQPTRVSKRKP